MRLPILVANAVRSRKLILRGQRVLAALSGGPDSVALFHCLLELSRKRDLAFSLCAAHLHHGLRGRSADRDEAFCRELCAKHAIPLLTGQVNTPKLAAALKKSREESARIARHAFLSAAAAAVNADCVAVGHHADDRIETVLYRICRGTSIAGLQGIGWRGPLRLHGEPDVSGWLRFTPGAKEQRQYAAPCTARATGTEQAKEPACSVAPSADCPVVRPLLACSRAEVLAYLLDKRQRYCTDETNFDVHIPRNALRNLVLPLLEKKVHPGARGAIWRLAEEAEAPAAQRGWRRDWLAAFAGCSKRRGLALPVTRDEPPPDVEELSDMLDVLSTAWNLSGKHFTRRHAQALQRMFQFESGPKRIALPSGVTVERKRKTVTLRLKAAISSPPLRRRGSHSRA